MDRARRLHAGQLAPAQPASAGEASVDRNAELDVHRALADLFVVVQGERRTRRPCSDRGSPALKDLRPDHEKHYMLAPESNMPYKKYLGLLEELASDVSMAVRLSPHEVRNC